MTESELIVIVGRELKGLSVNFSADNFADAVDSAERDTGFLFPTTVDFQIKWLKERTKRHLFFFLLSESTTSFKFKQINLQQKFEQLYKLIEKMDVDFEKALEDNVLEFAQADATQLFGHKVDAGFAYDAQGNNITYDVDQLVIVSPNDES
jgi:hypothetical protein